MRIKNNYLNWRSAKIVLIVAAVFITLLVGLSKLVEVTTPKDAAGNVTGDSFLQPVLHLIDVGSMFFIGGSAIIVGYLLLCLFFRNTIGRWAKSDDLDSGWRDMSNKEKTRWALGAVLALACALASKAGAETLPVSQAGLDLIVKYEVGGRAYYEKRLTRPTVPAWRTTASGVTVGFGYDCGYNSRYQIGRDWKGVASPSEIRALQSVAGKKGRTAYYAHRAMRHQVHISYAEAERVFQRKTLPRFSKLTAKTFELAADRLHPDCNGALVSLVFNRGSSMKGSRRKEMRWIRYNISVDREDQVPYDIRHMKRLWSYRKLKGLHLRRDAEARLFQRGLRK